MIGYAVRPLLLAAFVLAAGVALPWAALAVSQTVTIQDFSFTPSSVTLNAGDSVTWLNAGRVAHTATSNNPGFDTGVLDPGASKTIAFGTAGTFDYHCAIHISMRGTVTVLAAVVTTPPPTPPPTAAPTSPPTIAPTAPPTPAPTSAPTSAPTATAVAPGSSAPATQPAVPSGAVTAAPVATAVAAASPSPASSDTATQPAPVADAGPLPFVLGVVVVAGIAGIALYAMRRR